MKTSVEHAAHLLELKVAQDADNDQIVGHFHDLYFLAKDLTLPESNLALYDFLKYMDCTHIPVTETSEVLHSFSLSLAVSMLVSRLLPQSLHQSLLQSFLKHFHEESDLQEKLASIVKNV